MTLYHLVCPKCSNEFNFNYNPLIGISKLGIVVRYGMNDFSVKCPSCRGRSRYSVGEEDIAEQ